MMDFKTIIGEYLLPLDRHIQRWLPGFVYPGRAMLPYYFFKLHQSALLNNLLGPLPVKKVNHPLD
jgi:hypothetical protein